MAEEAERFKDEDVKRRELVEARNQADQLAAQIDKDLAEHGDKVSPDDKKAIEASVATLKEAAKADDVEQIKSATQAVMQAAMKLGEAIYGANKEAAEAGGADDAPQGDASRAGSDNVVDADFEEVKDDKKKSG